MFFPWEFRNPFCIAFSRLPGCPAPAKTVRLQCFSSLFAKSVNS